MTVEPEEAPEPYRRGVASLRAAEVDPAVSVREVPAPARLAPHAFSLACDVPYGDDELATGRFVVLHDPDRPPAWDGDTRVVVFVRAEVEDEMAGDPLLPEVAWAWLLDALTARGAAHRAPGGTVTRTISTRFGSMASDGVGGEHAGCEIEVRCSWTATDPGELAKHLAAFCDVLCEVSGLPPAEPGVARLPLARQAGWSA